MIRKFLLGGSLVLLVAGCASKVGVLKRDGDGNSQFPGAEQLRELKAQPPPDELFDSDRVQPESWEVIGPLTDEERAALERSPLHAELAALAGRRAGLVTIAPPMHCLARELGRFRLRHKASPVDSLGDYMTARCGATERSTSWRYLEGEAKELTDEQLLVSWKEDISRMLAAANLEGLRAAGIALVREEGQAVVMLVSAQRQSHLTRPLEVDSDGNLVLEGELLEPADRVRAEVTRGTHQYGLCEQDASVRFPRFRFTCQLDKADPSAWLEVASYPAGRMLGPVVLSALLSPDGSHPKVWRPPSLAQVSVPEGASLAETAAAAVNMVRSAAGLPPMALEVEQSRTAHEVAPHYFGALAGKSPETYADFIVLGLMAGWDVRGVVGSGAVTAATMVAAQASAAGLVAEALEKPQGRRVLLDPASTRLAVGALGAPGDKGLAVVFASYELMDRSSVAAETEKVRKAFEASRAARNLPPSLPLREAAEPLGTALVLLDRGEGSVEDALDAALSSTVARSNQRADGYWITASSLDELKFPQPLLEQPTVRVQIELTHLPRDEKNPWGRYLIMMIYSVPEVTGTTA